MVTLLVIDLVLIFDHPSFHVVSISLFSCGNDVNRGSICKLVVFRIFHSLLFKQVLHAIESMQKLNQIAEDSIHT